LLQLRIFALLVTGTIIFPASAWGDEKADCMTAHEEGQVARRAGRFDRAREAFAVCQRDVCPAVLRTRCADFARDLEAAQPSVVVMVRDKQGADIGEAHVGLDGAAPVSASTLTLGVRLNPGAHVLRVDAPGFLPAEKTITLPEGVKDMQAIVSLDRPKGAALPPGAESMPQGPKTAAWGFAIGSGVSLVAAGVLTGVGWGIHSSLESSCAPNCTDSQAEPLRVIWPASFVALGVGVVSGIVATILFTKHPQERTPSALVLGPEGAGIRFQ
jgi:hypothetical protein